MDSNKLTHAARGPVSGSVLAATVLGKAMNTIPGFDQKERVRGRLFYEVHEALGTGIDEYD